jgi:predicted RNA-binding Zn-ribbon protein involved in translation (DUF1610 family)
MQQSKGDTQMGKKDLTAMGDLYMSAPATWYTETRKAVKVICPECRAIGTVLVSPDGRDGAMFACHKCGRIARTAQHIKAK